MIRTFIAIDIPMEVKRIISRAQDDLRRLPQDRVAWTRADGIHLTLKFLGDVEEDGLSEVNDAVAEACKGIRPFELRTGEVGGFPRITDPRVLFLSVAACEDLIKLQGQVDKYLSREGFERDRKRFHPHLTVGRVKSLSSGSELPRRFKEYQFAPFSWTVSEIRVMASQLKPAGAVYTILKSIPLIS